MGMLFLARQTSTQAGKFHCSASAVSQTPANEATISQWNTRTGASQTSIRIFPEALGSLPAWGTEVWFIVVSSI